jgi:hypothetical protein
VNGKSSEIEPKDGIGYGDLVSGIGALLEIARRTTARSVNAIMTATYWEIGRRIVEFEQGGAERAQYGKELLKSLSVELTARFGRGFSRHNLARFRSFYLRFPPTQIRATLSLKSRENHSQTKRATLSSKSLIPSVADAEKSATVLRISSNRGETIDVARMVEAFPLPWSHYVLLIRLRSEEAIRFYHAEALRGGWAGKQDTCQQVSHRPAGRKTPRSRDRQDAAGAGEKGDGVVEARLPMGAESLNCGIAVPSIGQRNNMIPVPRGLGKAQQVFGAELKTLIDELNGVLVA